MRLSAILAFSILTATLGAAGATAPYDTQAGCSLTVQVGPLQVRLCDLSFSSHPAKPVTMLWDTFPCKQLLSSLGPDAVSTTAEILVEKQGLERFPKARKFLVFVAEIPDRDSYGLPRWDTMKILCHLEFDVDKQGGLVLKP